MLLEGHNMQRYFTKLFDIITYRSDMPKFGNESWGSLWIMSSPPGNYISMTLMNVSAEAGSLYSMLDNFERKYEYLNFQTQNWAISEHYISQNSKWYCVWNLTTTNHWNRCKKPCLNSIDKVNNLSSKNNIRCMRELIKCTTDQL